MYRECGFAFLNGHSCFLSLFLSSPLQPSMQSSNVKPLFSASTRERKKIVFFFACKGIISKTVKLTLSESIFYKLLNTRNNTKHFNIYRKDQNLCLSYRKVDGNSFSVPFMIDNSNLRRFFFCVCNDLSFVPMLHPQNSSWEFPPRGKKGQRTGEWMMLSGCLS